MSNIRIVEYEPKYAGTLADMWNKSGSGWGGENGETTENSIIKSHENSVNINSFVALDGEEAVGYCGFCEYREDEGALYIPLLNVRSDCHGKGIGKALVLKAVERCIELGWPRLDLYTWPGNTKAVPLYKKCGFFWEKRDDITHLMNFIPTVLHTEAVQDYFSKADWYADSTRNIEISADGDTQNGFDYFGYSWEKDGSKLRMEFERKGRGLRFIETDDYLLYMVLETSTPVSGKRYKAYYHVLNKTVKELQVSIKGRNNKNICYSFETDLSIADSAVIESEFYVDRFDEEPSQWRTHPSVAAELLINGKKAEFKIGVAPKLPVKLAIRLPGNVSFLNTEAKVYIEAENNFDVPVTVEFMLESSKKVAFTPEHIEIVLDAKGRTSIPVSYVLKEHFLYTFSPDITCSMEDGTRLSFSQKLDILFGGYTGSFWGEDEECWFAVNGRNMIKLLKADNELVISSKIKEFFETVFFHPRMGKPYSGEFAKKKASKVEFETENGAVVLKATYASEAFKNLELVSVSKLSGNGILERYYEVNNTSDAVFGSDVWVSENIFFNIYGAIIPYEGKYIENRDSEDGDMGFWDASKITENWIFSINDRITKGIAWSKNCRINMDNYYLFIENNLGRPEKGKTSRTESVYIAYDTFASWKDFRAFATGSQRHEKVRLTDNIDFTIDGGNPFVRDAFEARVKDYKQTYLNDSIIISSENGCFEDHEIDPSENSKAREAKIAVKLKTDTAVDIVKAHICTDTMEFDQKRAIFRVNAGTVKKYKEELAGLETYTADNGCINIKAAPDFAPSLFSMSYNGNEWLDNSFPVLEPRSWFNPWVGGIELRPEKFLSASEVKEPRDIGFAALTDNMGNQWQGLRASYTVEQHAVYKGLKINQYFLLMPGCPVMCHTAELVQNSGRLLNDISLINMAFIASDEDLLKRWYVLRDRSGRFVKYKCGRVGQEIQTAAPVMHGSDARKEKLLLVTDYDDLHFVIRANNMLVSNSIVNRLLAENGSTIFTQPVFYVFTDSYMDNGELRDLKGIKFEAL